MEWKVSVCMSVGCNMLEKMSNVESKGYGERKRVPVNGTKKNAQLIVSHRLAINHFR